MRPVAVIWSFVLHVVLLAAVVLGLPWQFERPRPAIIAAPIQGVIVDQVAIERERAKQEAAARQERLQQQREDRQRREQQQVAEQQRVAAERRAREDAQRKEEDRLATERAEQQRRKQEAEALARAREESEKRAAEQRRRQQAESELQEQLAAEAEANAARAAGLLDQYMLMIQNHVKRHWQRPLSARQGTECLVNVVQLPTGDVVSARVDPTRCNGDEAVRRSIENAVAQASPLPRPPSQAVFSRTFTLTFAPDK